MLTRVFRIVLAVVLCAALAGAGATTASSQEEGGEAPPDGPADAPPDGVEPTVAEAVADGGSARVIVALEGVQDLAEAGPAAAEVEAVQADVAATIEASADGEVVRTYDGVPGLVAEVGPEALDALAADPQVVAVTEDVPEPAHLSSSVPVTGAPAAHALGYDGSGGNVAVLDSGVDKSHPALAGRVVAEACFSSTGGSLTSSCPNGGPEQIGENTALPCTDTGCDHGTHVAGTVSSTGQGAEGSGAAPGAGIIAVKVFGNNAAGSTSAFISDQEEALQWLIDNRVALDLVAVNMSLGAGNFDSQTECDDSNPTRAALIGQLRDAGVPVLISSGNDAFTSSMGRPGCFTTAMSVGATTDADVVAGFSNNASFLDLLAPGVGVCAPVPAAFPGSGCTTNSYDTKDGTSMAAPHAAAVMAMLRQQNPDLTSDQLLQRVKDMGTPVTDTRIGADNNVTPRVDIEDALFAVDPSLTVEKEAPASIELGADVDYTITATNTGNQPLTGVTVADAQAPGCAGPQDDIPVDGELVVECSTTPGATGPVSNTATVDTDQTDPVDSNTVETEVVDCLPPAFSDVGQGHPFFEDICWMASEGISTGFGDGTYKPAIAVSRQAMSAFMFRLAGEPPFVAPGVPTFPDVPLEHPFFEEIEWMADEEITTGFGDGTYKPSIPVSRAAMSAFMFRLAGEPAFVAPGAPTFPDVPLEHPFFEEIEWMADEEITTGFGDGTYKPGAAVSRQAMSAFMHRLADGPGVGI